MRGLQWTVVSDFLGHKIRTKVDRMTSAFLQIYSYIDIAILTSVSGVETVELPMTTVPVDQ